MTTIDSPPTESSSLDGMVTIVFAPPAPTLYVTQEEYAKLKALLAHEIRRARLDEVRTIPPMKTVHDLTLYRLYRTTALKSEEQIKDE